ncbi:Protein INCA1 [Myotis davidii]|uniref:Protein INCA1 n=1 Tax=Myotis davidii TaxID=225400 RepID=L5LD08_MYODS|nr:Protein INCA1 [Myotis davidii]
MKRLSPASQPSPVLQVPEDGDNLIPFAKCSRVVSRSSPTSLPSQSLRLTPQHYGDVFWDNLSERPRLKTAQWRSSGAAAEPLVPHEEASCGFPSTSQHPRQDEEGATYPQEDDHFLPPGRAQLLWSPWSPLAQEGSFLSRQLSSLTPYSTVTACRSPPFNTWGMELPEE